MHLDQNTSALISGGASGLGEACVRRRHESGATVVILDLPNARGHALADELGERAVFVPGDVTDEAAVADAVRIASESADLRVCISCASIATPGRLLGRYGPRCTEFTRSAAARHQRFRAVIPE
jgi:NAD(P)-dependent dehydrogenase (short-subunit alcohol dehydrogenase family)